MQTRIFTFGAYAPDNIGFVRDQTRAAKRLRNDLVAGEHVAIRATKQLLASEVPEVLRIQRKIARLTLLIRLANKKIQGIKVPSKGRDHAEGLPRHERQHHPEAQALEQKIQRAKKNRAELWQAERALEADWHKRVIEPIDRQFNEEVAFACLQKAAFGTNKQGKPFDGREVAVRRLEQWGRLHDLPLEAPKGSKGKKGGKRRVASVHDEPETQAQFIQSCRNAVGPNIVPSLEIPLREKWLEDPSVPEVWKFKARIDRWRQGVPKYLGNAAGAVSGVKTVVCEAFNDSKKKTWWPKFVSGDSPVRIGRQIVMPVSALYDGTGPIKMKVLGTIGRRKPGRGKNPTMPSEGTRKLVEVTFGASEDTTLRVVAIFHRDLPKDGQIKFLYLKSSRIGLRTAYELQFTVGFAPPEPKPEHVDKTLAVNFGWRRLEDQSVRVATAWDGTKADHVVLPARYFAGHERKEGLLAAKDAHFNKVKKFVASWLDEAGVKMSNFGAFLEASGVRYPDWVTPNSLHQWRAPGKLAVLTKGLLEAWMTPEETFSLWKKWLGTCGVKSRTKANTQPKLDLFPSPEQVAEWAVGQGLSGQKLLAVVLEWWRRKDEHLTVYARELERRLVLQRREVYRRTAYAWSQQYGRVVIEDWNKAKTARRNTKNPAVPTRRDDASSALRQQVGVSVFTAALNEKFKGRIKKASAVNITIEHFQCGGAGVGIRDSLQAQCTKCGRSYDQDFNAAKHLWHRERPSGDEMAAPARDAENADAAE
jgi:hypothetical protein